MALAPIVQYPLDLQGNSPTNRIEGEVKDIRNNNERAFVPVAGPFYSNSFVMVNNDTGEVLQPVDDYLLVQPLAQAALRSGRDVQSAVILKIQAPVSVRFDYQVVGGEYSWNLGALVELINQLDIDERPIKWGSIIGRPTSYPPAPHMHDIGDTFGWEYVVWELERIAHAILIGDEASHEELRVLIRQVHDDLKAVIDATDLRLEGHIADKSNPHETTKEQVGLGLVDNFPTANRLEAENETVSNRFMTPERTYEAIMIHAGVMLDAHINDKSNPHQVTKAQVGLSEVDNFPTATKEEAKEGTANNRFLTPLRLKEVLDELLGVINDRLESDSIANEAEHEAIRQLISSMRAELLDAIRRSGQKQIIAVDSDSEIYNSYVITANCRVKLPAKDGLKTGDMVLFWKLPSVEPVIWSEDTVIETVNGTDWEVLYNRRDDITFIFNASSGKWEV